MRPQPPLLAVLILLLTAAGAQAQTTYRWVDPSSGRTVISDKPPPEGARQVVTRKGEESNTPTVPYATRQAAEKFPVVLYSAANCADNCKNARELLNRRGIPFEEKMVQSNEDIDNMKALFGGEATVPSVLIGKQGTRGFEAGAWNNLLDLAGYPKSAPYGAKPSGAFAK